MDGVVLRRFADAVLDQDPAIRRYFIHAELPFTDLPEPVHHYQGPRGVAGAVPHDMGSPYDAQADAYTWRNVKLWKDLAPKFVLMVLRHYRLGTDKTFLQHCWPAVSASINYLSAMIDEGQTIPYMTGQEDTFDNLASYGISVYCGSLWVAGLTAGAVIAREMGQGDIARTWMGMRERAQADLTRQLWNDATNSYLFYKVPATGEQSDDIFADQLLADLWLTLMDLPTVTSKPRMALAIQTVLNKNFHTNSPGVGAANMVAADGATLKEFQAQDIWLGVQYSVAATAFCAGKSGECWNLLEAQYDNVYSKAKIAFGVPEGFNASLDNGILEYTAGRYLRPGMIWVFAAAGLAR